MATQNPDDIVRLVTAPKPALVHIWQQALADEGIKSQVVGDYLDAGVGDIPGFTAELWVHRDDVARAEEIIRDGRIASDEGTEEEPQA